MWILLHCEKAGKKSGNMLILVSTYRDFEIN